MQEVRSMNNLELGEEGEQTQSGREGQNKVLCEIGQQINLMGQLGNKKCIPLKVKEGSVKSGQLSTKKAPLGRTNKQNIKQIDDSALKIISYATINRTLQQKNLLIEHQKGEISVLKQCVSDIKKSREVRDSEEERSRHEEMLHLKEMEREYSQNLREFQGMKKSLGEIKKRYDNAMSDKSILNKKYKQLLEENEQLTIVIAQLKADMQATARNRCSMGCQAEVVQLKQELRQSLLQKQACESRCSNFERRLNQYVLKYNEVQGLSSQNQIKYYRLQKESDNWRVDRDQLQQRILSLSSQLQAQRQMGFAEGQRLRDKLKKQEQFLEEQTGKCHKLEQKCGQLSAENERLIKRFTAEIKGKDLRIGEMEVFLSELSQQIKEKKREEDAIALKIKGLEESLRIGSEYLNNQKQTLHSENRSLTEILSLHQRKIQELTSKNEELSVTVANQKQQLLATRSHFQSIVADLQVQNVFLGKELQRVREEDGEEKRYYRQKYERELEQYNELSNQFRELSVENSRLLTINANNAMEMGTLKNEVVMLQADIDRLVDSEESESQVLVCQRHQLEEQLKKAQQQNQLSCKQITGLKDNLVVVKNELFVVKRDYQVLSSQLFCLKQHKSQLQQQIVEVQNRYQLQLSQSRARMQVKEQQIVSYCKMMQQKQELVGSIKAELEKQVQGVRYLTSCISQAEAKYDSLVDQYRLDVAEWQNERQRWREANDSRTNERRILDGSKISVSLQGRQTALEILRNENTELQRILGSQIQRRNATILELIGQKKSLFEQLMRRDLF